MLVNHEGKRLLPAIPILRLENGRTLAAAAHDLDAIENFLARAAGKIVGEPGDFMAAPHEFLEIRQRNALRASRNRIARVAPVQHQETHENQSREIFSSSAVVDLPGTNGTMIIFPPADSTARRSS